MSSQTGIILCLQNNFQILIFNLKELVREYLWQSCYCIEWQFQKKKKSAKTNKMTKEKEFIAEGWHLLSLHKAAVRTSQPLPGRKSPEMTRKNQPSQPMSPSTHMSCSFTKPAKLNLWKWQWVTMPAVNPPPFQCLSELTWPLEQ